MTGPKAPEGIGDAATKSPNDVANGSVGKIGTVTTVSPKEEVTETQVTNPAKNATISRSKRTPPTTVASDQALPSVVTTSDQVLPGGVTNRFKAGGHINILNGVADNLRGLGVVDAVTRTCELGNVRAPKELWLV